MEVLFRSYELDTAELIVGSYIKEDGFYIENGVHVCGKPCTRHYIQDEDNNKHEIAPEYLSINFEDMLDSEGNKIFASLSEDGKGGDIAKSIATMNDHGQKGAIHYATVKFRNGNTYYEGATLFPFNVTEILKVTGIQQ